MNEKILVEVFVPAIGKKYDVFVPLKSKMHEVVRLVAKSLSELSEGKYRADQEAVLCDRESGKVFDINSSVYELEIKNGSKMMLI